MSCPTHLGKSQNPVAVNTSGQPMPVNAASSVQDAVQLLIQTDQPFIVDDVVAALKKKQSPKTVLAQMEAAVQSAVAAGSLTATPRVTPDGRQVTEYVRQPKNGSGGTVTATGRLPIQAHQIKESRQTQVNGGKAGAKDYFVWAEFRRPKLAGTTYKVDGKDIKMGDYVEAGQNQENVSCLRRGKPPLVTRASKIRIGNTVPDALRLLANGEVVETKDGLIELYDSGRQNLVAVYDPKNSVVGDTNGAPTISAEQVAAYLAYHALHPEGVVDYGFITDLKSMMTGQGTEAAAADSAMMLMKETDGVLKFGGQVGTKKCVKCGRFMGDSHACPMTAEAEAPVEKPAEKAEPEPEPVKAVTAQAPVAEEKLDQAQVAAAETPGFVPMSDFTAVSSQMANALNQLAQTQAMLAQQMAMLQNGGSGNPVPLQVQAEQPAKRVAPKRPAVRKAATEQEKVFGQISVPAPDPFLTSVPKSMGGNTDSPVAERIPEVDPDYFINEETRSIMNMIAATAMAGAEARGKSCWSRSFGLYGPPGTGKNELIRQFAASIKTTDEDGNLSQGVGVVEVTITDQTTVEELLGGTVLESKDGGTDSKARLGKIGLAAAAGRVIAINEIARNPKIATALQELIEDGTITTAAIEGETVPIHPGTFFFFTWNPGNEGDPERPALAPLDRMTSFSMTRPSPEELKGRVDAFFAKLPVHYKPSDDEVNKACTFFYDLQTLGMGGPGIRALGKNSDTQLIPSARVLGRFCLLGKQVGWEKALETVKIYCDQDEGFNDQWKTVVEAFNNAFGRKYAVAFQPRK